MKNKIITSATKLFIKYGYKRVTMNDIARDAGMTKKTVYSYIKDKSDLLKHILYIELEKMKEETEIIEKKNISFEKKIHEFIYFLVSYKEKNELLKVISQESKDIPNAVTEECMQIIENTILLEINEKMNNAIKNNEIKNCNVELMSFIIYKIYLAILFEWNKPLNEKEITENMLKILKKGLFI